MARLGRAYPSTRLIKGVRPPVVYDATGAGTTTAVTTISWAHSIGGNAVLAAVMIQASGLPTAPTATVGSTAMTPLLFTTYAGPTFGYYETVAVFALLKGPTGSQTISVTSSNWGTDVRVAANSVSYKNVTTIGTAVTASGAGGNPSVAVSSAARNMVANVLSNTDLGHSADATLTAYNQTQRYNQNVTGLTTNPLLMGDAAGAPTVTFTATGPSDCPWYAVGVPLTP